MSADPFDGGHLVGHVKDSAYFEVPRFLGGADGKLYLPQWRESLEPLVSLRTGFGPLDEILEPLDLRFTKFMALELLAAVLIVVFFVLLALRLAGGQRPKGRWWNMLESILLFIRDDVARPAIGQKDGDRFLPYLWTVFFFVLACNLMGMVPWLGSPTGALATTGALAGMTFLTVLVAGSREMGGLVGFGKNLVPHMDLPWVLAVLLLPMVFLIEVLGLFIKHFVLAVRLLANMMAGHLVLAVIVAFIAAAWHNPAILTVVAPASIVGATALSLLELFVAFLQAYIFTFLSALFIGMAVHPH